MGHYFGSRAVSVVTTTLTNKLLIEFTIQIIQLVIIINIDLIIICGIVMEFLTHRTARARLYH